MNFNEIKKITQPRYSVDVDWVDLKEFVERYKTKYNFDFDPDFQRNYVWTEKQKINYIEYILKGGLSGKDIFINHPGWMDSFEGTMVLVDGKQRISAVLDFLNDKIKAFDHFYSEFKGFIPSSICFKFHINNLKTKNAVYEWYINLNTGGSMHTEEEIEKVKNLINK